MKPSEVIYSIEFEDKHTEKFSLLINSENSELCMDDVERPPPAWTALEFLQCPNCPLVTDKNPLCPLAHAISYYFLQEKHDFSYARVSVSVTTAARIYTQSTTLQQAYGSLLGLISALSGCPRTAFLKPMAMFHLPFANEMETISRSVSYYLLGAYLNRPKNEAYTVSLKPLVEHYQQLQTVNTALANRMRKGMGSEPAVNAIILLDLLAKAMPLEIDAQLVTIAHLFRYEY